MPRLIGRGASFWLILTAALIAAYLILLYPASFHPGSLMIAAPGGASVEGMPQGDGAFWLWCMWWGREALAQFHVSPYECPLQNFPLGVSLLYTPIAAPCGMAFIPLREWASPLFIYNFWMAVSLILTSLGVALIACELGYGRRAAVLAAAIFFLTPFQRHQLVAHPNIASTCWPILTLYFLVRLYRRQRWIDAGWAAALAAITLYTSHYHALFLAVMVAVSAVWLITRNRSESLKSDKTKPKLLLALFTAALFIAPSFAPFGAFIVLFGVLAVYCLVCLRSQWTPSLRLRLMQFAGFALLAIAMGSPLSLPLLRADKSVEEDPAKKLESKLYFSNTPITPFLTPWTAEKINAMMGYSPEQFWRFRADEEFASFPGWTTLALVLLSIAVLRKKIRGKFWLYFAFIAYVLSLGVFLRFPRLIVWEAMPYTGFVLPGSFFFIFPMFQVIRVFSRFAFYFDLGLGLFVAANYAPLLNSLAHKPLLHRMQHLLLPLLVIACFAEKLEWGVPTMRVSIAPDYRDYADLPAAPAWFLPEVAVGEALLGQTIHSQPIANVLTSREDPSFQRVKTTSLAWNFFNQIELGEAQPLPLAPDMAQAIRSEIQGRGIRHMVLMKRHLSPDRLLRMQEALRDELHLRELSDGEDLQVFGF